MLGGEVAAIASLTGDLTAGLPGASLAGVVGVTSAATGDLSTGGGALLAGTVSAVSAAVADLSPASGAILLAGTVSGVSTTDADLTAGAAGASLAGEITVGTGFGADLSILPGGLPPVPLSTEPVNAQFYKDLNTGCVYELESRQGCTPRCTAPRRRVGSGGGGDAIPPDVPVIKAANSSSDVQEDGTSFTAIVALVGYASPPAGLDDLDGYAWSPRAAAHR